jgi:hypothetical protein
MMNWERIGTNLVSRELVTGLLLMEVAEVVDETINTRVISTISLEKEMDSPISLKPFLVAVAEKDLVSKPISKVRIMRPKWKLHWKRHFRGPAGSYMWEKKS